MAGVDPVCGFLEACIGFHPEQINCNGCRLLVTDYFTRDRKRCVITGEIIHYPQQRGLMCPLSFEEVKGPDVQSQ